MTTTPATRSTSSQARTQLHAFLSALAQGALAGSFFELRERHEQHMRRRFYPAEHPDRATSAILRASREHDIYIGAAPRARAGGGRAAIATLKALWVDADTPEAIKRIRRFEPAPSIVVASGGGWHAYWLLERPVDPGTGEHANRRLVDHLAADPSCTDAVRILRPPHTLNHGYRPPRPVRLLRLRTSERYALERVLAAVPELRARATTASPGRARERSTAADALLELEPAFYVGALLGARVGRDRKVSCPFHALSVGEATADGVSPARSVVDASSSGRGAASDPLLMVPPPVYFERLTGLRVGPSGKLHCLFHDDRSPSLHVYPEPERGWFCFGCRRGGSVYDLAALLFGLGTRGRDFVELRRELERRLLPLRQVSHSTRGWTP